MLPRLRWLKGLSLVSKTYLSAYQEEESNSCRILSENLMQILQKKKKNQGTYVLVFQFLRTSNLWLTCCSCTTGVLLVVA